MGWARTILHLDMDAFYASIEQLDNPKLRGKPVLVGHDGPRGVVSTSSYEARKFGCHSAQPMVTAKRLCPEAIVVPVRMERYREVSARIFRIFDEFSPLVESLSLDEAFLDLTGTEHIHGTGVEAARKLKARIKQETGVTGSAGVAACKFVAKLASDLQKPDGLTVIGPEDYERVLPPLPITKLWGIGKVTAKRLEPLGLKTIGDLRKRGLEGLKQILGQESAQWFWDLAHGADGRAVVPDRDAKSISNETTFETDLCDAGAVRDVLLDLTENVAGRLRGAGMKAGGVHIKVRFGEFQTITRSATLREASDVTAELWQAARGLFDTWARAFQPVRLIGIAAERLCSEGGQLTLFSHPEQERQRKLDALTDQINGRFGKRAIRRGGS